MIVNHYPKEHRVCYLLFPVTIAALAFFFLFSFLEPVAAESPELSENLNGDNVIGERANSRVSAAGPQAVAEVEMYQSETYTDSFLLLKPNAITIEKIWNNGGGQVTCSTTSDSLTCSTPTGSNDNGADFFFETNVVVVGISFVPIAGTDNMKLYSPGPVKHYEDKKLTIGSQYCLYDPNEITTAELTELGCDVTKGSYTNSLASKKMYIVEDIEGGISPPISFTIGEWRYIVDRSQLTAIDDRWVLSAADVCSNLGADLVNTQTNVADPINTRNGNLSYQEVDLSIPVVGCPLQFQRDYASGGVALYTDTLGHGWSHNYDMRLHFTGVSISDTVEVQTPNGSRLPFIDNGDDMYTAYDGVTAAMSKIGSSYIITGSNQKVYTFNSSGLLLEQEDPAGNVITFTYNITNQLTRAGQGSRYLTYTYDGNGRLVTVEDNLNRTVTLAYDGNGDLTVVTNTLDLPTTYTYSGTTHLMTSAEDPSGRTVHETAYDVAGRAYRQWDGEDNLLLEINYLTDYTRIITENGVVMTHTYDSRNTLVSSVYACTDGTTGCGTGSGIVYDGSFRQDTVVDANDNAVNLVWNANGANLTNVADGLGNETVLGYDAYNNLTQVVNARDIATTYRYDHEDFPTFLTSMTDGLEKTTYYTPTTSADGVPGLLKQLEDANGRFTTYTYNNFGQVTEVVRAAGTGAALTTTYGYDGVGRLITTTQESTTESHTSLNVYDDGDRLIATIGNWTGSNPANWGTDCDTATGTRDTDVCTQYEYDDAGRIISTTNTLGQTNLTFYDDAGRSFLNVTNWDGSNYGQTDPVGDLCSFTNPDPEFNLCAVTGYDTFGRVVTSTNSLGHKTVTDYDSVGRVERTIVNWENGVYSVTAPDTDIITEYEYDAVGNVMIITDTLGRETRTFYDALNRVAGSITNWDGSSTLANCATLSPTRDENICTQYAYDAVGNTAIVTNTLTQTTRTFYDNLNRVQATVANWNPATLTSPGDCVISATNTNSENICTLYGYDAAGNQITTTNALNQTNLTVYDDANRPFLTVANWDGTTTIDEAADCSFPPTQPDTNLCAVTSYDSLGRRSSSKDAMGNTTEFTYDGLGRVLTTTRTLDSTPVYQSSIYDALGNRLSETNGRGHTTTFSYDDLNRLQTTTSAEGIVVTTTYNAAGWVITTTDGLGHATVNGYDDLGRRTTVTNAENNSTTYEYDGVGNQTGMIDAENVRTTYVYDDLNRLVQVIENDVTGDNPTNETDVTTQYVYDALGNRIVITNAKNITNTYTIYDGLNRPIVEIDALGNCITTTYNALGSRTTITDGNEAVTTYEYDGLNRLTDVHYQTDSEDVAYAYDAIGNRQTMTDSVGVTSYQYDDLYRLTSVTDPFTGTVTYAYDLAGNRTGLTYPDSKIVTTTYDMDNRMTQVEDWDSGITAYAYDSAGRLITTTLPNSVQTVNVYDDANRLIQLTHTDTTSDTLLADYEYELDKVGNRAVATETVRLPGSVTGTGTISLTIGNHVTVTTAAGNQTGTAVAHNLNADDYLAVWQDNFSDTGDLYAQRLNSNGGAVLSPTLVHSPTTNTQQATAVAFSDADDNYLVVWQDGRTYASRPDLYGRVFTDTGTPITTEFTIEAARRSYETPDVVFDPNSGDFVVVWTRETGTATQRDIRAQFVTVTGTLGTSINVATTNANEYVPALATDGSGNFLAVWRDNIGTSADLYAQRFDANGLMGSVITITTATNRQDLPDVAYESTSDQYLIVWEDDRSGTTQIYGQRVNGNGTLTGSNVRLDSGASAKSYPAVAETSGVFVVGWGDGDLYLRTVDTDGNLGSVETLSSKSNTQQDLALTHAGTGNILAAWESNEDGNDHEVVTSLITVTNGISTSGGGLQTTTITYDYDPLHRLTDVTYSGEMNGNTHYTYDAIGNRTYYTTSITTTQTISYYYNAANQLTSSIDQGGITTTYEWDDAGRLITTTVDTTVTRLYSFSQDGDLLQAVVDGITTTFTYNGDGNRLQMSVDGEVTTYTLDYGRGFQLLYEEGGAFADTKHYLYGLACLGEQVDEGEATEEWRFYQRDGSGLVRQTTDADADVTLIWTYSPEGGVLIGEQGPVTRLDCGSDGIYDWSTGLIFKNGRYFDPSTGIWITMGGVIVWQLQQPQRGKKQGKKSRRRRSVLFLIFILVLLTLVGCGVPELTPTMTPCPEATVAPTGTIMTPTFVPPTVTNMPLIPTSTPPSTPTDVPTSPPTPTSPSPTNTPIPQPTNIPLTPPAGKGIPPIRWEGAINNYLAIRSSLPSDAIDTSQDPNGMIIDKYMMGV